MEGGTRPVEWGLQLPPGSAGCAAKEIATMNKLDQRLQAVFQRIDEFGVS
jgi:hypothetical protein